MAGGPERWHRVVVWSVIEAEAVLEERNNAGTGAHCNASINPTPAGPSAANDPDHGGKWIIARRHQRAYPTVFGSDYAVES